MHTANENEVYSIQINIIDSVMRPTNPKFDPTKSLLNNSKINRVPVLQIFGKTEEKNNGCIIIHGFFPTIFIDYLATEDERTAFQDAVLKVIQKINGASVYSMEIITRTAIYGYHEPSKFLKIELLSLDQKQISAELRNFVWNDHEVQVYEGHIPFFMHFFRIYNITGCANLQFRRFYAEQSEYTKYKSELHIHANDIISIPANAHSQILSHFNPVWSQQRELHRRLNIETQAQIASAARHDLIFTQRPPTLNLHYDSNLNTQGDRLSNTQELEKLLSFIENFDPDETINGIEHEMEKTQIEVNSILEKGPLYHTPASFLPMRVEGTLKPSLSQEQTIEIDSFATQLVTENTIAIFQHEKTNEEVKLTPKMISQSLFLTHVTSDSLENTSNNQSHSTELANSNEKQVENSESAQQSNESPHSIENYTQKSQIVHDTSNNGYHLNETLEHIRNSHLGHISDNSSDINHSLAIFNNTSEKKKHAIEYITVMFIEVGCITRMKLLPDPRYDPIRVVSYAIVEGQEVVDDGVFYVGAPFHCGYKATFYETESSLFSGLTEFILKVDPDIIVGYNTEKESIGYLSERALTFGTKDWFNSISRLKIPIASFDLCKKIGGRIIFNTWRFLRRKEKFRTYDLSNAANEILGAPFPEITNSALTSFANLAPHRFIHYFHSKVMTVVAILFKKTIIEEIVELALVVGLDFGSTLSRGSQFYIESLLSRVSWRMGYLLNSPTSKDVANQRAPMSLPLVMEPESGYYKDPVMVIDFTSLYPSCLIAYNLDYSTVIGRSADASRGGRLGYLNYFHVKSKTLEDLLHRKKIINTPNDVLFVTKDVRPGVMPALLTEILKLRAYVKQMLKQVTDEKTKRILDARQGVLKAFAACAYGYTSAHYSGRMPCVEIGDSIVECSRHMLEFVIDYIEKNYTELHILYGDTDSLFIQMPPASKAKCFDFAQKLCDDITALFPSPVTIKLEKIFSGCFLVNKKRYCGWMYESVSQEKPTMDVKGLEMKRRDSCLLVKNVMTDVIEAIFRTGSIDKAKSVFLSHFDRIVYGRVPVKEFLFAREVRLGTYKADVEPPGVIVAKREMLKDPRILPLYGERYPYLVVSSAPNSKLVERVISPKEYLDSDKQYRIGTKYYIDRQIVPALGRVLETMGIDVTQWATGRSKELFKLPIYIFDTSKRKTITTMERFCKSTQCPLCNHLTTSDLPICSKCLTYAGRKESLFELIQRIKATEKVINSCNRKCSKCLGILGSTNKICLCSSCEIFWTCKLAEEQNETLLSYKNVIEKMIQ